MGNLVIECERVGGGRKVWVDGENGNDEKIMYFCTE